MRLARSSEPTVVRFKPTKWQRLLATRTADAAEVEPRKAGPRNRHFCWLTVDHHTVDLGYPATERFYHLRSATRRIKQARPDPTFGASRRCKAYNERKKSNRACWSAGDSISRLEITVLASEPLLA